MRDARYLRAQAEFCLEMARQMSDQTTSENLRAEAARYHAEATEIETGVKTPGIKASPERELIPCLKRSMSALVINAAHAPRTVSAKAGKNEAH